MEQALAGLRVLDLTHYIAGPYCTKLLAGLGAEVIKIEKPGLGDGARRLGPFPADLPHPEKSGLFLHLNTGKKSITLNLKTTSGRDLFLEMVKGADLVVENFEPRVMPSLRLDYATLEKINPRLVMTSISNFGQTGPYRDFKAQEIVEYAISGLMYITGEPDREPIKVGGSLAQYVAGQTAFVATLTALYYQFLSGTGQQVDVSIMETNSDLLEQWVLGPFYGVGMKRLGSHHQTSYPSEIYEAKDGYVAVNAGPGDWSGMAKITGRPELNDPRFAEKTTRAQYRDLIDPIILPWVKAHGKVETYHAGQSQRFAFGYVANIDDVVNSAQLKARQFFVEIDHPVAGKHTYTGPPYRMGETPFCFAPAPLLGQHNEEVYERLLGHSKEDLVKLRDRGII